MAAPLMPAAPFAPFVVQANGLSALYRTNGTSWQMDASGILASTDALFWGAVGGTGTFWFPVAPGITTLPTAPAVVNGEMTVTSTVPTWNETVVAVARTSTKLEVTSLPYALSLLTEVAVTTRTQLQLGIAQTATHVDIIVNPSSSIETGSLLIPVAPAVIATTIAEDVRYGDINTVYVEGTGAIAVSGVPIIDSSDTIVFTFNGANGVTSAVSTPPASISPSFVGSAMLSTARARFGQSSLLLDGDSQPSWISYNIPSALGLADFCIEFWLYTDTTNDSLYSTLYAFGGYNSLDIDFSSSTLILLLSDPYADWLEVSFTPLQWQHIAIYRESGIFYLAVDGEVGTPAVAATADISSPQHYIGDYDGTGQYAVPKLYIDEVRITPGLSVYTSTSFAPPEAPF